MMYLPRLAGFCAALWAFGALAQQMSGPGLVGGGGGGSPAAIAANAFYVSALGNDANAGTAAAPFLTPGKCQTAMRASSTSKTCYLRAGTYPMTAGLTLDYRDANETWSYYPPDGINTANLTQNSSFRYFTLTTGADNVIINGLAATGFDASVAVSCTGTKAIFVDAWGAATASLNGPQNLTVINNVLNTFHCGIVLVEAANPVVSYNQITNIGYAAVLGNHVVGLSTQTTWRNNIIYDILPGGSANQNTYGFVLSPSSFGSSSNITLLHNGLYNCHTWACYNSHGGTSIWWINNIAVYAGSTGGNSANFQNAPAAPDMVLNDYFTGNVADMGSNSSFGNANAFQVCGSAGCASNTGIAGVTIANNTSLFGAANGTQIYNSPNVTVSGNTGALNPETVSSITFPAGATSASFVHGLASAPVANLTVTMSQAAWPFPMPPGTLSIGGANTGGFVICNISQICQSAGGTAAGTYNDFTVTATLHGMNGSPATIAAGTLTLTGN